ncbi:hypothetical protein Tco_0997688, partial [Tanacetum coccineum]
VRLNKMIHRLVMALPATFHPLNLGWQRSTILGHPMLDGQISRAQSRKEKDGSQNAHLYLDVFEKYTQFCKGSLQQHLSITFEGVFNTQPISPLPSDRCLETRVNSKARRGENPQPVYNAAMSSPFTYNQDPNQTGPSISNRSKRTAGIVRQY